MDNRFQFVLLTTRAVALVASLLSSSMTLAESTSSSKTDISDINNEVIELGIFAGMINVEDFGSEIAPGISATFRASEDFFIQYNFLQADISLSSYENNQGQFFGGKDRKFQHYDLLIGYNLFQGEFFPSPPKANLSTLYLVGGVGNTEFGNETSFTYTLGVGYQVALTRKIAVHVDFRDYLYQSTLITDDKRTVSATQISLGAKYCF